MRPGQVEHPVSQVLVAVLGDLLQAGVAAVGHAGDQIKRGRMAGHQGDAAADGHDRVQHGPCAAGQCFGAAVQGCRPCQSPPTAYEASPIGFVGQRIDVGAVHCQHVAHPRYWVLLRARPSRAENRLQRADQFGLDEQLAEGRVQGIAQGRCQHHFSVAGQLKGAGLVAMVGQVQAAQFDVVLGRHGNFGVAVEVVLAHAKLRAAVAEDRLLDFRAVLRRLVGGGPVSATGNIAQVTEAAQVVAAGVFVPASDRQ